MELAQRTDDLKAQGDIAVDRALILSAMADEAGSRRAQESAVAAYSKKGIIGLGRASEERRRARAAGESLSHSIVRCGLACATGEA